jgi:hypothetical protein
MGKAEAPTVLTVSHQAMNETVETVTNTQQKPQSPG